MRVRWWRRLHAGGGLGRRRRVAGARAEDGFSIVETMVALGVIFAVMMGLLASLSTGVRGLLTGRQRTGAITVAKEIVETARASDYDDLGHDLSGDTTLEGDASLTGTAPDYQYQPEGAAGPEYLVGSVDAVYPEHEWEEVRDSSTYTVKVYVTRVVAATGDDHKRLTVAVAWAPAQYSTTSVANEIVVSTFVSRFGVVAGSEVSGVVDVDSGAVTVTGTLAGANLSNGKLYFPLVHADVAGDLVNEARGYASSSRSELTLTSGSPTGCSTSGTTAACDGVRAETLADNDGRTAPPLQHQHGPFTYAGGTVSAGPALSMGTGSTASVASYGSAESCTICSPSIGDGDALLYASDVADGPASMTSGFDSGLVSGNLVGASSGGSSTATIDADAVTGDQKMASSGRLVVPAIDLVSLSLAPVGFTSAVSVGSVDVTAAAQAGPTASAPSVTGNNVSVQVYDTGPLGVLEYRTIVVSPGQASEDTAEATFQVGGGLDPLVQVSLTTTVTSAEASTESTTSGGTITSGRANLTNWLVVTTQLLIVEAGITVADLTIEVDYGRVVAQAGYVGS